MSKTRNLSDLLDANGDVKSTALDNVPASNDASALTTGTLDNARLPSSIDISGTLTANGVDLGDSEKIRLGASQDLEIYHNGTDNYIYSNNKTLRIQGNGSAIKMSPVNADNSANFNANGSVDLYYDNSKKFETTSTGASVTGRLTADATDEKPIVAHHTDGSAVTMGFQNNTSNSNTIGFDGTEFEVKGGGSTSFKVNSSGRFFASGGETISVGFWAKWRGTGTVTLEDDFNVSSIGDVANGQYDVNFTVNCGNSNYAVAGTSTALNHSGWNVKSSGIASSPTNLSTGSVRITSENTDSYYMSCIGFGDW